MTNSLTPKVAMNLIRENNGGTVEEIVGDGLNRGIIKGTVKGQRGALGKLYNGGELPDVKRDKQGKSFHYYLKDSPIIQQAPTSVSGPITFRPTLEQEGILSALTEIKKCSNRSEAVQWLLKEGIASKRKYITEVMQSCEKIERIRQQANQIGS